MLGWEPHVALREGVTRTVEYFRGLLGSERMRPHASAGSGDGASQHAPDLTT